MLGPGCLAMVAMWTLEELVDLAVLAMVAMWWSVMLAEVGLGRSEVVAMWALAELVEPAMLAKEC